MQRQAVAKVQKSPVTAVAKQSALPSPAAHSLIELQRSIGNRSIQRLINSSYIQTKLQVSTPGDESEQEADRVADIVMRMPGEEEKEQQTPLMVRRAATSSSLVHEDDNDQLVQNISAMNGSGNPLPEKTRAFFEPRFGADFSHVRVHTDSRAAETSQSINANAFTIGPNIAFARGRYAPHSHEGQRLLAHELTHVVQQSPRRNATPMRRQYARAAATGDRLQQLGGAPPDSLSPAPEFRPVEFSVAGASPNLVQRNIFSDIWQGITEATPAITFAVTRAIRLVETLITNPAQVPMVVGAIAWELIPERLKGPLIDRVLQVCLALARRIEFPGSPGLSIGPVLKHAAIGFLEQALSFPSGMKVRIANRMALIVNAPSMEFSIGFLKGLVLGLWDGLTGPFILLWDLIKIAYEITEAQLRFIQRMLNHEERDRFGRDVQLVLDRVEGQLSQVIAQLRRGRFNPLSILRFIDQLTNAVLQQVQSLGASLANSMLRFFHKPDRELGESLGWVQGTLAFEVLLLILTEGGYTVLKNSIEGLKLVTRLIQMGGRAWEALGPVRAALVGFRNFARGNRALAPLIQAVEEVFGLLFRFLRFSYGLGGPTARGAGHVGGAAERAGTHEIRVANTAMRETHEITLLADGRLIRCSNGCMELTQNIIQRATRLAEERMPEESRRLIAEARQIGEEARAVAENAALAEAERAAQNQRLMRRASSLERQTAAAELEALQRLAGPARRPTAACRDLLERHPGVQELSHFTAEVERLETEIRQTLDLIIQDSSNRQFASEYLRELEREATALEAQMRSRIPAAPTPAPVVVPTRRRYAPTAKHRPGGQGTLMDLDDAVAQRVLDGGIVGPNGRQVYGYHNGRLYEFQPDNVGGFHGYPVPGNQVPTAVLRQMRDQGLITNAEYRRFTRGQ